MSNREKLRERIFGILYTLFGSLMFIVGLTTGSSKALLGGFAFLIIGSFSWIKLAMHSNPRLARLVICSIMPVLVSLNHQPEPC